MAKLRPVHTLLGVITIALMGCAKQETTPEPEVATAPPPPAEAAPMPPPAPAAQSAETASAAPAPAPEPPKAEPLTDEQIVKIVDTVNAAEIEQAKLAQKKSKNAKVKKFAAQMIADHNQAKNKANAWVKKAKITPADSTVGSDLASKTTQSLEMLKTTETDFDKAYIDGQIEGHQKVLDVFDKDLLPNAKAEDLKKFLTDTRATVDKHLTHAKEVQAALAAAPPSNAPSSTKSVPATGAATGSSKTPGASLPAGSTPGATPAPAAPGKPGPGK